MEGDDIKMLY